MKKFPIILLMLAGALAGGIHAAPGVSGFLLAMDISPEESGKHVGERSVAALAPGARDEATSPVADPAEPPPVASAPREPDVRCNYLITVADDFIVDVYKNGKLVPDEKRELLLDRFGASAEKIQVTVRNGDWLVFHVVSNRLRWGGSKYFAAAGCFGQNEFGFVTDPGSAEWSVCDDPASAGAFIRNRSAGRRARALAIEIPWGEGDQFIKEYAGNDFDGKSLWGRASSTWIKFVASDGVKEDSAIDSSADAVPDPLKLKRWPVQILSAIYGTGGKNADVTAKVKEHVEAFHRVFSANPTDLGADPNPYWNKGLHITYMKDGVRREQHRNENETILPESFYGPQDAGELRSWLPESRWFGSEAEIQFHADQTFTSPGESGVHRWEAMGSRKLRLIWSENRTVEMMFDYTWSSFSEVENGRNVFHVMK